MQRLRDFVQGYIESFKAGLLSVNELQQALGSQVHIIERPMEEEVPAGQLLTLDADGRVRPLERPGEIPIGIAIDGDLLRVETNRIEIRNRLREHQEAMRRCEMSWSFPEFTSSCHASVAFTGMDYSQCRDAFMRHHQYQYSKFPEGVEDKAWELLKKYMTDEQHFAFMEGTTIERENAGNDYRLLLNKSGNFTILQGPRGSGIVATSGRIRSYDYPLGDEMAAFLDWFRYRTEELIANWNCGTYGIVKKGQRR